MKTQCIFPQAISILVVMVLGLATNGVAQTTAPQPSMLAEEKEPLLALAFSVLIPGLGQYYNGDVTKGVIQEVLVFGGFVAAITAGIEEGRLTYYDPYFRQYYDYGTETETTQWFWVGLGVSGGAYLWSIIDAPLSAMSKNQKARRRYGHLLEFEMSRCTAGLDFKSIGSGNGLRLAVHF